MKPVVSQNNEYPLKAAPVISHVCPRCGHTKSWASSPRASDKLFRILFYRAHRCRACMSRFWTLQSSFRLSACIITLVALMIPVGLYGKSLLASVPITSTLSLMESDKIKRRAQEGDANAALQLGIDYMGGRNDKNYKEGSKWLEQAARKNNTEAQYYYGLSLLGGRGVIQDYKAGFFWLEKAARKGHAQAQYTLGKMYRHGNGVEIDRVRAYLWFNLAAAQGIQEAIRNRDSIASHLALSDVIAMQEEAYRISGNNNATNLTENTITPTDNATQ